MRDAKLTLTGVACAALAVVLLGCSGSDATSTKDEERNFKGGMTADTMKKLPPPPKIPSGPLKAYEGGSSADKALGR